MAILWQLPLRHSNMIFVSFHSSSVRFPLSRTVLGTHITPASDPPYPANTHSPRAQSLDLSVSDLIPMLSDEEESSAVT